MKLKAILLSSLDGVSNQGEAEDHHAWTSKEDQEIFLKERDLAPLIIMGSRTYEAQKPFMVHTEGKLRVIMTRNPKKYDDDKIPGKLEFTNENPSDLLQRLEKNGFSEGIMVGGAHTTTGFLKVGLIAEICLTIEPWIKGEGLHMVTEKMDIPLKLLSSERLNEQGTLLLRYSVGGV